MAMLLPTELLNWLGQHQFLSAAQVEELSPLLPSYADSLALAKELIRRDWLTPFQINQILQGKKEQLILGNYLLRERIGEGAMGQVYKAWNLRLARIVAVKTIHKEHVNSSKAMDRFRREVETAAQLVHPNIALVRDADEVVGKPFLVMDYIEGFNLSQRVKQQGPLPIADAVEFTRQAALGLQHAFEQGIVHRDIKPSNLIVTMLKGPDDPIPLVKILDFGLARYESERENAVRLTQLGNLLGTVDYISPEQAQNASSADIRADIYSLGCTLYYLLTGQPPFPGNSVVEKLGPRLTGEPPSVRVLRSEVPPALDELLRKMMARLPGERFQTPIEAAEALLQFTAAEPLPAPIAQATLASDPIVMAQPVSLESMTSGEVPMAQPILASSPVSEDAADESPFFSLGSNQADQSSEPQEEDPSFLAMSATGRDLSADGTTPVPALAIPVEKKPFSLKLALIFGAGGFFVSMVLCLGVFMLSSMFRGGDDAKTVKKSTGSIQIVKARFSVPSQIIKEGQTKFVQVEINRVEYKGPVKISLKDLPADVRAEPAVIAEKSNKGEIRFSVSNGIVPGTTPIFVVAESDPEGVRTEMMLELKIVPDR